jgi:hypothetical protein
MPTVTNPLISKQRIEDAQEARRNVAKVRLEETTENRRSAEKFYQNLAFLSGGTVALSVTYLGFLKTITDHPLHAKWLEASWAMLFLCLLCATFYSFFNVNYMGYARSAEYARRKKEEHETIADESPNVFFPDIQTKADLDGYIKELRDAATARGKDVQWNERKAKFHEFMLRACGLTARLSFLVGIGFLLLFAVANTNIPHSASQPTPGPVQSSIQRTVPGWTALTRKYEIPPCPDNLPIGFTLDGSCVLSEVVVEGFRPEMCIGTIVDNGDCQTAGPSPSWAVGAVIQLCPYGLAINSEGKCPAWDTFDWVAAEQKLREFRARKQ